jgi:hypothetical protein
MRWSVEKQLELYDFFLRAKFSDNTDYIQEQLNKMYSIILENNIGLGDGKVDFSMIYNMKDKTINGFTQDEYYTIISALLDNKCEKELVNKLIHIASMFKEVF